MGTRVGLLVRPSHEGYDGGGHPDGLRGEETPLGGDSFNAMTTTRSYRKAPPVSHAVAELERGSARGSTPP
jgi:response regulator RpfG family c-di-GMP phosphodiesterase